MDPNIKRLGVVANTNAPISGPFAYGLSCTTKQKVTDTLLLINEGKEIREYLHLLFSQWGTIYPGYLRMELVEFWNLDLLYLLDFSIRLSKRKVSFEATELYYSLRKIEEEGLREELIKEKVHNTVALMRRSELVVHKFGTL